MIYHREKLYGFETGVRKEREYWRKLRKMEKKRKEKIYRIMVFEKMEVKKLKKN